MGVSLSAQLWLLHMCSGELAGSFSPSLCLSVLQINQLFFKQNTGTSALIKDNHKAGLDSNRVLCILGELPHEHRNTTGNKHPLWRLAITLYQATEICGNLLVQLISSNSDKCVYLLHFFGQLCRLSVFKRFTNVCYIRLCKQFPQNG